MSWSKPGRDGASYPDALYETAGAEILPDADAVFGEAQLIVKVKEPQPEEIARLGPQHVLFTHLHLAASKQLTEELLASSCTALAYETLKVNHRLPLLEPMSEIAGRMSAIIVSYHLANHRGGRGPLLGGVPGVAPGRVMVIGGGAAGINTARVAPGIGAVLVPGAAAPKLITREMFRQMQPGSVFVDIAIDQGDCSETSRPTTHDDPTYFEEDVLHYCVANITRRLRSHRHTGPQ